MEKDTPISMKNLKENKMSKTRTILATAIITFLVIMTAEYLTEKFTGPKTSEKAPVITLADVIVAQAPETKSIIFLDRKTGKVNFSLADSVSLIVYTIKAGEISADYTSKVTK